MTGVRVIVTGAAAGIGAAIADAFAACGAQVQISDIDAQALSASRHAGCVADMGKVEDVERFMAEALGRLGGLDVLVNNTGIAGPVAAVESIAPADLDTVLRVNLSSQFHTVRLAVAALKESGRGCIVNLSSAAGKFGFSLRTPYSASKWGVIGLTRSLAIELGPHDIRVNAILPGAVEGARVRTILAAKAAQAGVDVDEYAARALAKVSLRRMVPAEDIANMALYLASPFGACITGQAISVDAGMESMS
ncbi:SDR family oxidoreductase [Ramlibacter sp.]|uniref:SDR family oxidoreductase n=1 Tax=Ramlibacter sp. TaxID=1917967 RepID=UPI002D80C84B|nr:SDR family oxidoreductase [Ramlibacter sp.]